MNPAKLNQELEEWLHKTGMILGTWCDEAPHWWEAQTNIARKKHKEWLHAPQSDKYGLEKIYKFGGALPIPVKSNCVETVLRVELADPSTSILPGFIIESSSWGTTPLSPYCYSLSGSYNQPSADLNKMVIRGWKPHQPTCQLPTLV
eukprot:2806284-Amphidinium_carterae.3